MEMMKCLFLDGVKKVSVQECPVPEVSEEDVLVRIQSRGICGTDLASYRSGVPGGFGHEMAGVVARAGARTEFKEGDRVFISNLSRNLVGYAADKPGAYIGAFAEYIKVCHPQKDVDLYPLPDEMSFQEAALMEPFSVAMSGVKKVPMNKNAHVAVLGGGIIGLCAYEYLKAKGIGPVVLADIVPFRLARAAQEGAAAVNTKEQDLKAALQKQFGTAFSMTMPDAPDVDLYLDAAGVGPLLGQVVDMLKYNAAIVVLAIHRKPAELNMQALVYNNAQIHGSVMFSGEDLKESRGLLATHHDITKALVTHCFPLSEGPQAFETADQADTAMKVMITG